MDDWAAAQRAAPSSSPRSATAPTSPRTCPGCAGSTQATFARTVAGCRLVVAHAGMGSVITAGQFGKPIVMLPRLQEWGEHTTDHQIATANWLREQARASISPTATRISARGSPRRWPPAAPRRPTFAADRAASTEFIARIRQCILG